MYTLCKAYQFEQIISIFLLKIHAIYCPVELGVTHHRGDEGMYKNAGWVLCLRGDRLYVAFMSDHQEAL